MTLEEKKALLAELTEKHGPNDGAVIELAAEIEAEEAKPAAEILKAEPAESDLEA